MKDNPEGTPFFKLWYEMLSIGEPTSWLILLNIIAIITFFVLYGGDKLDLF